MIPTESRRDNHDKAHILNQTPQIRHREGQGRARKAMSLRARGGGPRRGIGSLPVVVVACVLSFCVAVSATSAPKARTATTASATRSGCDGGGPRNCLRVTQGAGGPVLTSIAAKAPTPVSKNLAKVVKAFSPATIPYTGTSILKFKIFKCGGPIVSGIGFVDMLPAGPSYSPLPSTCVPLPMVSGSMLTVSGVSLPAGPSSCLIRLRARQAPCGKFQNTAANVTGATNVNTSALNATPTVVGIPNGTTTGQCPPKVRKVFDPATVAAGFPANLTFTISNPFTSTASGVGFTDTLPAGLSYTLNTTTTCVTTTLTGNVLVVSGVRSLLDRPVRSISPQPAKNAGRSPTTRATSPTRRVAQLAISDFSICCRPDCLTVLRSRIAPQPHSQRAHSRFQM